MAEANSELTARIRARLSGVPGPDGVALDQSGRLSEIVVRGGRAYLFIAVDAGEAVRWEAARVAAQQAIEGVEGVVAAAVSLSAERGTPAPPAPASPKLGNQTKTGGSFPALAEVRHIIAVASGKGGVGKSTTACNLALALHAQGLEVGLLDADIYGPSAPRLFGLRAKPSVIGERTLVPLEAFGIKVMSIGFVVEEAKALVWRGPMVMGAITQMLRDVAWGKLDVLIVDMPPGTGDAQLTMAQSARLSGAVIVSTPQDLALIDARKGVAMFQQVDVPILGIVENMSYFICDGCGKRHEIFAHGGARREAERLGVPLLGEIALDPLLRERSDMGLPMVVSEPDSEAAAGYRAIAAAVWTRLSR